MDHEPYIRLSRIRDYGLERDPENVFLRRSELDALTVEQLTGLREILVDEIDDIDYQIAHEMKHLEHDAKWHYGAKSSKKARADFISYIDQILEEQSAPTVTIDPEEVEMLRAFHFVAHRQLSSEMVLSLESQAADYVTSQED